MFSATSNHYRTLQIDMNAHPQLIDTIYRHHIEALDAELKRSKQTRRDVAKADTKRLALIEAYVVLSDPALRSVYTDKLTHSLQRNRFSNLNTITRRLSVAATILISLTLFVTA